MHKNYSVCDPMMASSPTTTFPCKHQMQNEQIPQSSNSSSKPLLLSEALQSHRSVRDVTNEIFKRQKYLRIAIPTLKEELMFSRFVKATYQRDLKLIEETMMKVNLDKYEMNQNQALPVLICNYQKRIDIVDNHLTFLVTESRNILRDEGEICEMEAVIQKMDEDYAKSKCAMMFPGKSPEEVELILQCPICLEIPERDVHILDCIKCANSICQGCLDTNKLAKCPHCRTHWANWTMPKRNRSAEKFVEAYRA